MKKPMKFLSLASLLLCPTLASASNAITINDVNFRVGPGVSYAIRGYVPAGNHVHVSLCKKNWCRISYSNTVGWIASNYLAFNTDRNFRRSKHREPYRIIIDNDPLRYREHYHRWHNFRYWHNDPYWRPAPPPPPPRPYWRNNPPYSHPPLPPRPYERRDDHTIDVPPAPPIAGAPTPASQPIAPGNVKPRSDN